ncbi:hypothetical protein CAEBREN_13707 [Caenorhabditis brenneri]|uniref:F-box domain-containing protein n=1 Tax=Caenorhabditis brenneri TaxID=135651 RepID=G0NI04_CAEBE|nr:hypothetical protein CAEBREN_13707 [Caenorhabditis brenneri]
MGFPILRLPFLALKIVVNHLNDVGLVTVSLLSKKADRFLKACGKKNVSFFNLNRPQIRVLRDIVILELLLLESRRRGEFLEWDFSLHCELKFYQYISIRCNHFIIPIYMSNEEKIDKFARITKILKVGDLLVPLVITKDNEGDEAIHYILSSENDGLKTIFDCFKNKFNSKIEELNLSGTNSRAIKTVCGHIHSTQTVVRNISIEVQPPISGDDFEFILKNVSATERFSSHWEPSPNFKFEGTIGAKNINIENGDWCTIQNLIAIENEVIHVNGSEYTKEELKTFLNEWKAGKLPKLKRAVLATEVPAWDVLEEYDRWEGECAKCVRRPRHVIAIKGPGGCHGCPALPFDTFALASIYRQAVQHLRNFCNTCFFGLHLY